MEPHTTTTESGNNGLSLATCREQLCSALERFILSCRGFAMRLAKIARDDPRRVAHSLKVGLALTLVSVLYYVTALFNRWGESTVWAVITVVVVMDFTVASAATFSRFIPEVKARYDYGVLIFVLTFAMVTVSSYRVENLIEFAHERVTTIAAGVATCLFTTIFVFPIWAGDDLHMLAAGNLDKLAEFLEGMESEYFGENSSGENVEGKAFLQVYKGVLNSKATEDYLITFAKWEPIHGKFGFRHPWNQYQKLGALSRQCASSMEALASCISTLKKSQYHEANPELCLKIGATCAAMSLHSAKALRGLSLTVRTMTKPSPINMDMSLATKAASDFRTELSEDVTVLRVMHVAIIASLLSDIVIDQIERIMESTNNLAHFACFKNPESSPSAVVVIIED